MVQDLRKAADLVIKRNVSISKMTVSAQLKQRRSPASRKAIQLTAARSPGKFASSFQPKSADVDVTDPIYKNEDPIGVSMGQREGQGSILSQITVKNKPTPFFFDLKLKGPGLEGADAPN